MSKTNFNFIPERAVISVTAAEHKLRAVMGSYGQLREVTGAGHKLRGITVVMGRSRRLQAVKGNRRNVRVQRHWKSAPNVKS